jgi:hypothetical protein
MVLRRNGGSASAAGSEAEVELLVCQDLLL